jgi:hypothetical protein
MKKVTTANNAEIKIYPIAWKNVFIIKNAVLNIISESNIDIPSFNLDSIKELKNKDIDINSLISSLINIDTNEDLINDILNSINKWTYEGEKIDESLFDAYPKAREDYYEIIYLALKEVLQPFFKNLPTLLGRLSKKEATESLKQK